MEGQITLTEYLKTLIEDRKVWDLTTYINSKGKAQYTQIKDIIAEYIEDERLLDSLTNQVSVYVLRQGLGYMEYLRQQAKGE